MENCYNCIKRKTMLCPNSSKCYDLKDKPFWSDNLLKTSLDLQKENEQLKKQLDDKSKTFLKENVEINKITKDEIADYADEDYCLITMEQFTEFKNIVKDFKVLKKENKDLIEWLEDENNDHGIEEVRSFCNGDYINHLFTRRQILKKVKELEEK